jgi:hypothetical protein
VALLLAELSENHSKDLKYQLLTDKFNNRRSRIKKQHMTVETADTSLIFVR